MKGKETMNAKSLTNACDIIARAFDPQCDLWNDFYTLHDERCGEAECTADELEAMVDGIMDWWSEAMGEINDRETSRLIKAAPDLLAAIQSLISQSRLHVSYEDDRHALLRAAIVQADKAIAKATATT